MFVLLITKSDLFDKMYQEINRQNTFYFWIIGIVITIAIAISAFIGVLQWRLSDKQIEKMKSETQQGLEDKYHFSNMQDKIDSLQEEIKSAKKQVDSLSQKIDELRTTVNDNKRDIESSLNNENYNLNGSRITIDPDVTHYSVQKFGLDSDVISMEYADSKEKSAQLSDRIKNRVEDMVKSNLNEKNSLDRQIYLGNVSDRLINSNNDEAHSLGEYLRQKYNLI